jgi:anti-anti-sigma factor
MASAGRFRSVGDEAVATNRDVIVDLAGCRFIDSTGIGWVVRTAEQVQRSGRRLVLVAPNSQVRRVFELTRVTDHVPTHNSMESALQSLAA